MSRLKAFFILPFLIVFVMFGCHYFRSDVNKYTVNIKFDGAAGGEKLEAVNVVVGADKFWWASFEANEEKSVNLFSDKNAVNNLTLQYTLGGTQRTWESANFGENADYRIDIKIDSTGSVTENSCRLPCL